MEGRDQSPREALFIYFLNYVGQPSPQIIHDVEMFEYQLERGRISIVQRHEITAAEADLGINKLKLIYPCVRHTE